MVLLLAPLTFGVLGAALFLSYAGCKSPWPGESPLSVTLSAHDTTFVGPPLGSEPRVSRESMLDEGNWSPEMAFGLSKEQLLAVIHVEEFQLQRCCEVELAHLPPTGGRVRVKWMIATDGHVREATVVESTLGNRAVEQCIADAIRRWKFPPWTSPVQSRGRPVEVVYRWAFGAP